MKTKLATEARCQHARRQRRAAFSRRQEIVTEESILIDFPQDSIIQLQLEKFLIHLIAWQHWGRDRSHGSSHWAGGNIFTQAGRGIGVGDGKGQTFALWVMGSWVPPRPPP